MMIESLLLMRPSDILLEATRGTLTTIFHSALETAFIIFVKVIGTASIARRSSVAVERASYTVERPFIQKRCQHIPKESGFKTLRRTDWLSFEHSSLALENLARFHAMSKILIDRGLIKKTDFTHNSMCTDIEFGHKLYAGPLEVLAEAMVESWGHEWKEVSDRIKLQVPLVSHKINELAVVQDDRYLVFNHGDLWTCNIMMKPEKSTTAESLRFLDFQVPCINTFIWDVIIFMFTSTHPQVRRRKQDDLLSVYQKSLEENLRSFNCQSYVPNLNDVISEFERVWYLSFVFNMTFFPLSSSSKCKPFEISKVLDYTPQEVFDKSAFTDERLVPELQEDLKIYIEKGVI
uniref:CHK kinase-like domain-containing protein n=1 Tax=Lygus hesperus TaxID=30085 RepID=A0A146M5R7_LYGHE